MREQLGINRKRCGVGAAHAEIDFGLRPYVLW
jgi:hypothetical protein